MAVVVKERKSNFVRLFDKTPPEVICPHFYELVLSNGCPFDCLYCYLKLTFKGNTCPKLFNNPWSQVERELESVRHGVFATGELADSLAVTPPLLSPALDYFEKQNDRYLLLLTKSTNTGILEKREPSPQVIVSFSINSESVAARFEKKVPSPLKRLDAAKKLTRLGWRVRIRLDPIVLADDMADYKTVCRRIAGIQPERITVGSLRQYPGVMRFSPNAPREGLRVAPDGRLRYPIGKRILLYSQIEEWLGQRPALCKETKAVWQKLGWKFEGCNCTE